MRFQAKNKNVLGWLSSAKYCFSQWFSVSTSFVRSVSKRMKTATASLEQQQRRNTHPGRLFHPLLVSIFLIAINSFSATGFAQVSQDADEVSGEASVVVADNFETGEATYRYFIIERPSQANDPSRSNSRSRVL